MLRAYLALILTVLFTVSAPAQDTAAPADARAATGGAQTLEDILARQRGLGLSGDYSLPRPGADTAAPPTHGTVPQLGTRGLASDSDIWRQLRDGARFTPSSSTAKNQLMQVMGDDWRLIRRTYILAYSPWILLGVICLIALFYLVRGPIRIAGGRSGKTIPRFSMSHRIAHWFLAGSFILMGVSGLIILLGRPLLMPLVGKEVNAVLTSAALQGHNLFGPVFILSLLIVIVRFMRGNFFQLADLKWILKGGGLLGGHASSHHYNFGEKTWYWVVVFVGLMMSATGMLLLFPWLTETLAYHQAATVLHAGGAILMICFALGHAYVGTIGMEGSIDSMLRGEVDENWAKEHHDLWYQDVTGKPAGHDAGETGADRATEGAT